MSCGGSSNGAAIRQLVPFSCHEYDNGWSPSAATVNAAVTPATQSGSPVGW